MSDCDEDIPLPQIETIELCREDNNFTELYIAVKENRVRDVQKLIQNKAIINRQTKDNGQTSLLLSCLLPVDTTIAKILINSGADVNLCDFANVSPLIAACKSETEKVDLVELLLQSGANINHQDNRGYTALHCAAKNRKQLQVVDLLLQSGADTSLSTVDADYFLKGLNPLMMAFYYENEHCAEKIIPFTEDLNAVSSTGWSALMYAVAEESSKEIIVTLVEQGASVNITATGYMPASLALECQDPTIFEYIWDLTAIDFLKEKVLYGSGFDSVIRSMLASEAWITPIKIQYFYKVLSTPGVDSNDFIYINESVWHVPECTLSLLSYSICYSPIDILEFIIDIKRHLIFNIPVLKLVKSILKLCTPSFKLRQDCIKYFKSCDVINYDLNIEDKVIWLELYNEILELLSVDRLPTLQELSRDKIRTCLAANCDCTEEYISKLNILQLPRKITDIIRCISDVNP